MYFVFTVIIKETEKETGQPNLLKFKVNEKLKLSPQLL